VIILRIVKNTVNVWLFGMAVDLTKSNGGKSQENSFKMHWFGVVCLCFGVFWVVVDFFLKKENSLFIFREGVNFIFLLDRILQNHHEIFVSDSDSIPHWSQEKILGDYHSQYESRLAIVQRQGIYLIFCLWEIANKCP
jgi:hypothetical protein